MSQIPIAFALATKNNLVGMLLGKGYEKLNFLHRFVGWMIAVAANVHGFKIIFLWTDAGIFTKQMNKTSHKWALVALISVNAIVFFSTSFWRRKAYNVFLTTHIIGFSLILPAVYYHEPVTLYYILAAAGVYGLDHLLRIFKTRLCSARIRPLPELHLTRIEMPYLNAGWRAGQHVRLRVLSSSMGWFGWAEAHPFTIASVSEGSEGMVLMCKKTGSWTQKLYQLGTVTGYQSDEGSWKTTKVLIEGPYGGHGNTVFTSYSSALFVIGGSGISFALSSIQELIRRDNDAASRLKSIDLIWSVQDPACLTPLIPTFTSLIQQSAHTPLRISVHYTRATPAPPSEKDYYGHPYLTLSAGRPRIGKALDTVISKAVGLTKGPKDLGPITGIIVAVCGPAGLGDDVVQAVGAVEGKRRDAVGGIEIFEEVFEI
jgi:predicted ferric reductase